MRNRTERWGTVAIAGVSCPLAVPTLAQTQVKAAATPNGEYKAQEAALKFAEEKKGDFVTACRALPVGTPTPVGKAIAAPAPTPVPTPRQAPPLAPARASVSRSNRSRATVATGASACGDGYARLRGGHTATRFCEEPQAKAHCGSTSMAWVNTSTKVYHLASQRDYGHVREYAYQCQDDAIAEGDRQTRNWQ